MMNDWYQSLTDDRTRFKTGKESTLKEAHIPLEIESVPKINHKSSSEEISGVVLHILEPKANHHPADAIFPETDTYNFAEEGGPSILSPPQLEHPQDSSGKCVKMGSTSTSTR